jgi:hypothetical protein
MIRKEWCVCSLRLLLGLVVLLPVVVAAEEKDAEMGRLIETIQQKLTLASLLIERMEGGDKARLAEALEGLQTRFLLQIDERLRDDVLAFLQTTMTAYRQASPQKPKADDMAQRRKYEKKMEEVWAFRESFYALVSERGDSVLEVLDEHALQSCIERAEGRAAAGDFLDAYSLADSAYHQLILAVKTVRDNETVEYRLDFDDPRDEYGYEKRRFSSQKMLLDMVVAEQQPSAQSMKLIDGFVERAYEQARLAERLAGLGDFMQAITAQEAAVESLVKAMRVAGIYF